MQKTLIRRLRRRRRRLHFLPLLTALKSQRCEIKKPNVANIVKTDESKYLHETKSFADGRTLASEIRQKINFYDKMKEEQKVNILINIFRRIFKGQNKFSDEASDIEFFRFNE